MRAITTRATVRVIEIAGGLIVALAVSWWGLVYTTVFAYTGFGLPASAPCLVYTSDLCTLAMSLCGGWHPLGITRYSSDLFWVGIAVLGGGLTINSFVRRA